MWEWEQGKEINPVRWKVLRNEANCEATSVPVAFVYFSLHICNAFIFIPRRSAVKPLLYQDSSAMHAYWDSTRKDLWLFPAHTHIDKCTLGLQRGYLCLWSITHRGIPLSDTNQNNRRLYLISFNICTRKMCKYVNSFVQWCIKLQKKRENKWIPTGKEVRNRAAWKHNNNLYV